MELDDVRQPGHSSHRSASAGRKPSHAPRNTNAYHATLEMDHGDTSRARGPAGRAERSGPASRKANMCVQVHLEGDEEQTLQVPLHGTLHVFLHGTLRGVLHGTPHGTLRGALHGTLHGAVQVPMSGIDSTEQMLHAAFDACAETVGMELEASDSKQISLRFLSAAGKEKKLTTKVAWEELRESSAIIIKLQHVGAARR